jgi:hypothetical protein
MNKIDDRLYYAFIEAFEETDKTIAVDTALSEDFERIRFFSTQVLANCFPLDFRSLRKVGLFPIVEAELELEYSLFFAKAGVYKLAYMCLRNFMELSLVCFHYLLTTRRAIDWVQGQAPTPFKRQILSVLFESEDFRHFDRHINIRDRIDNYYNTLSDICHTRGQPCSHMTLSKANYPRLVEETLHTYISRCKDVIDIVITCFVAVNPIILFPLPIDEKFGINGPLSGFLQEYQTEALRKLLKPDSLKVLLKYFESDPGVNSLRQYFADLPDITEEEFRKQLDDFDAFMKEMEARNAQQSGPANRS